MEKDRCLVETYGPLIELSKDLWIIDGEWQGSPFKRRMTIVRLSSGVLVIHNAFRMHETDFDEMLIKIGNQEGKVCKIAAVLVPNRFHNSEWPAFVRMALKRNALTERGLRVFVPEAQVMFEKNRWQKRMDKRSVQEGLDFNRVQIESIEKSNSVDNFECKNGAKIFDELPAVTFRENRAQETVFIHLASKTLIITDMLFNIPSQWFTRNSLGKKIEYYLLGKWNGIAGSLGPSKLTKLAVVKSVDHLKSDLAKILEFDFDRIIVNHGEVIEVGGKQKLKDSYDRVFCK